MTRHSEGCNCPPCERHYRQRNLWLGSIYFGLFAIATVQVGAWLFQLFSGR
jgi:hypothetical protein